jgi:hypothetical protein
LTQCRLHRKFLCEPEIVWPNQNFVLRQSNQGGHSCSKKVKSQLLYGVSCLQTCVSTLPNKVKINQPHSTMPIYRGTAHFLVGTRASARVLKDSGDYFSSFYVRSTRSWTSHSHPAGPFLRERTHSACRFGPRAQIPDSEIKAGRQTSRPAGDALIMLPTNFHFRPACEAS